jgi:phosphatidylglycerophosphate synthase
MTATALLFATAPSIDGGPAALLRAGDDTLVGRLLDQLESLGIRRAFVVTRPEWADGVAGAAAGRARVTVLASADIRADLLHAAEIARGARGRLLVGLADVLVHRRPLAVLLSDPRIQTGVVTTASRARAGWAPGGRTARGRVVAASSAYHRVKRPNGYLLGFAVVAQGDVPKLAAAAAELAEHAEEPIPGRWEEELERKVATWRLQSWRAAHPADEESAPDLAEIADPAALALDDVDEELLALRAEAARQDAVALLAVGLVRSGAQVASSPLRAFFRARPLSPAAAAEAFAELQTHDEDRLALDSAVKAFDGFFTTFFVSPYSKYIARFAARRGWTPNAMTTLSMAIGVLAAAAFAVGSRAGLIAGAVLLQAAFTIDCVDGQLARYTLTFSKLGAWLDSVFDRAKEYVVFAGLAIGASRGFDQDVWTLAAAALGLQTARHAIDFSYAASRHGVIAARVHPALAEPDEATPHRWSSSQPVPAPPSSGAAVATAVLPAAMLAEAVEPEAARPRTPGWRTRAAIHKVEALDRWTPLRWARRIFLLPIGERFAVISLTAALGTPHLTFVVLLAWGGVVFAYAFVGRSLRAVVT